MCAGGRFGYGTPMVWNLSFNGDQDEMNSWLGAGGIMLNGVIIFPAADANNVDPYYPEDWSGYNSSNGAWMPTVDACIGHSDGDGIYHYHIMSPCLFNIDADYTDEICNSNFTECYDDIAAWALQGYSDYKTLTVIGISKDGHPFFGPYDSDGNVWNCSALDMCNGITETNGSYAYYATSTSPYTPGCWGPAVTPTPYIESCSTNTCPYLESDNAFIGLTSLSLAALFFSISMMLLSA
jgi:hypothetical protein